MKAAAERLRLEEISSQAKSGESESCLNGNQSAFEDSFFFGSEGNTLLQSMLLKTFRLVVTVIMRVFIF